MYERIAEVLVLRLRYCANTFGVSPCTATGTPFCYNCRATCRDVANFDGSEINEIRFTHVDAPLMKDRHALRSMVSMVVKPGTLNLKEGVGAAGSLVATIQDTSGDDASDSYEDPYYSQRAALYDSTIGRKLIARHRYMKGQEAQRRRYSVDAHGITTLVSTDYFRIEEDPKLNRGMLTITCSDYMPRLKEALVPQPSTFSLSAAVDASTASFPLQSGEGTLVSVGDYLRFDDEIVLVGTVSTDTLTVTRAQFGTTAAAHSDDTRGQECFVVEDTVDAVWSAVLQAAGIDAAKIDEAGAETEVETLYDSTFTPRVVQSVPISARTLLSQLMNFTNAFMFYDSREGKFQLRLVRPPKSTETLEEITAEANIAGLPDGPVPQEDLRATRLYMYYDVRDWSKDVMKFDRDTPNFRRAQYYQDTDKESEAEFGEAKSIEVFAWGLDDDETEDVRAIGFRKLSLLKLAPRTFRASVPACDIEEKEIAVGSFVSVTAPEFVDSEGAELPTVFIVVGLTPGSSGEGLTSMDLYELGYGGKWFVWSEDAETDTDRFAQWCDDDGRLPDGSEGWKWI